VYPKSILIMSRSFQFIESIFGVNIFKVVYRPDSVNFFLKKDSFLFFCYFLKMHSLTNAAQLIDISCVDTLRPSRFELNYHFLSISNTFRYVITISVADLEVVPSLSRMFFNANWLEREV
jgi:NADH-quinone oxidoreductase subunit C